MPRLSKKLMNKQQTEKEEAVSELIKEALSGEEEVTVTVQPSYQKYVVKIEGKPFMTFAGCLKMASDQKIQKIETNLLSSEGGNYIFKAEVVTSDNRVFTGYGDACEANVTKKVAKHLLRMAETRAIARALRFALGIDMTVVEELESASFDDFMSEPTHSIKSVERVPYRGENK